MIAISKGRAAQRMFAELTNPIGVPFLIAISKGRVGAKEVHERDEPHRGSAFDSPGLPNDSAGYPGLIRSVGGQRHRYCAFLINPP